MTERSRWNGDAKENFDVIFMNHGTALSPFFAVGIGSELMVRVEGAKPAVAAVVSTWGEGVEDFNLVPASRGGSAGSCAARILVSGR